MPREGDVLNLRHHDWVDSLGRRPEICPEKGWLPRYLNYGRQITDAPDVYHIAVGLSVLAANLGNRSWLELFGGHVFPAAWHVLLGPSGYMRKSTSIRVGLGLLRDLEHRDPDSPREEYKRGIEIPEPGSKEAFQAALKTRGDGIMPVWEFGELLSLWNREHMGGTKEQLTRWYDGDSSSRSTVKDGTMRVKDPAITIIGASTPDWLSDRVKEGDLMGGFIARVCFWPADDDDKGEWRSFLAEREPGDRGVRNALLTSLNRMQKLHVGPFSIPAESRKRFDEWLYDHETRYRVSGFPRQLMPFHSRLPVTVLRLGMALEAASEMESMEIRPDTITAAISVGAWLKDRLASLFTEDMAFTVHAADQNKVVQLLRSGEMSKRDLIRKLRWPVRQFQDVTSALIAGGVIELMTQTPEGGGHTVESLRLSGDTR